MPICLGRCFYGSIGASGNPQPWLVNFTLPDIWACLGLESELNDNSPPYWSKTRQAGRGAPKARRVLWWLRDFRHALGARVGPQSKGFGLHSLRQAGPGAASR